MAQRWGGFVGPAGVLLVVLLGVPLEVAAQDQLYRGLPIGLPDFPRRVRRTLPQLRPDQEIKVGVLKLHPSFESTVEYDDNITLRDKDDLDDVVFTETPGLVGEVDLGDHRLEMGYGVELVEFVKHSEENATNHLAHGQLDLNFTDFHVTVSDEMEEATGRLFNETSARDHIFLNTVQILGRYDRPMWALEGGWTHNTIDRLTDLFNNNDYGEDVLSVLGGYKISPRMLVLLQTDLGLVNYDHNTTNPDHDYWQLWTGVRGELTSKVTSTLKLGFQDRQLSDIGGQGPQSDFDGLVADMELVYTPSVTDLVRLAYQRTARTSTYASNAWYRQDQLSLTYRKRFADKWVLTPRFAWQLNDYPEESTSGGNTDRREDHFLIIGTALRYEMREWLSTGLAWNIRTRNSNLDSLDYENNRFTFDVTVAF